MRIGNIVIMSAEGATQEMQLSSGCMRIGSAPDNDLIINGPDITPHHATIACDEYGRLVIEIGPENLVGQGGMRLTFNLAQVTRRRDLAWIGNYVISYQPPSWNCRTQPLALADLPANAATQPESAPTTHVSADETALLQALLKQPLAWQPMNDTHEAVTLGVPMLALTTIGE